VADGDAIERGVALVETIAPFGCHRITFGRDASDSFSIAVERLKPDGQDVRKDDLLPLLPRGSGWNGAVGWRSFVVLPFTLGAFSGAAVGVERVVPHLSRGAFPVLRAFLIVAGEVGAALEHLVAEISARPSPVALPNRRGAVWRSDALSPAEHERHEAPLLAATAAAWRRGERTLLRTVLLSDDQAPWRGSRRDRGQSFLIATVPPIRAHFSPSTRLSLAWRELLE
jgi:hypothetical protein